MPNAPAKRCLIAGCPEYRDADSKYCARHDQLATRSERARRGTAAERGYGSRWAKARLGFLLEHPICDEPNCGRPATDVHHEPEVTGPNDPGFWDIDRWRAKCHSHHSKITATKSGGFGNSNPK